MITTKAEYKFARLSELTDNGSINGAMSPMYLARDVGRQVGQQAIAVYRVWFTDNKMYQVRECDGMTGFDHLIICFPQWCVFAVDLGTGGEIIGSTIGEADSDLRLLPFESNPDEATYEEAYHTVADKESLSLMLKEAYKTSQNYIQGDFKRKYEELKTLGLIN